MINVARSFAIEDRGYHAFIPVTADQPDAGGRPRLPRAGDGGWPYERGRISGHRESRPSQTTVGHYRLFLG